MIISKFNFRLLAVVFTFWIIFSNPLFSVGLNKSIEINNLSYLSYSIGFSDGKIQNNQFNISRSYLTFRYSLFDFLGFRMTVDTRQDEAGDFKALLKYLYANFIFKDISFLVKPNIQFGLVENTWHSFEENINLYRMQGTMFIERVGIFNSAEFGITFTSLLGGEMDEEYQKTVNKKFPGKYGSIALGIYNGGGYHSFEKNKNKVFQSRLTLRPLPKFVPGLQISYLGIFGKGNQPEIDTLRNSPPTWVTHDVFLSFEHKKFTFTLQYLDGKGNQSGKMVDSINNSIKYRGYSAFAELKLDNNWRIIGRYDFVDPNTEIDNNNEQRLIAGIGYNFGNGNILILDYDRRMFQNSSKPSENSLKLTMQINF
jgi:hypothetical protein